MVVTTAPRQTAAPGRPAGFPNWKSVFGLGLLLWVVSVVVTGLTGNLNLIPTVILIGSFLVPATSVIWYLDHYQSAELDPWRVFSAFLVGGTLGVIMASILEAWLLSDGALVYISVGFVEELAKLVALLVVARGMPRRTVRDGMVLGAAVGFGFAALETSGYAFGALLVRDGPGLHLSLSSLVFTELLRGILAPVGHGAWTAILGGVLFGASRGGHLRLTPSVLVAYVGVSLLHGLWDSMRGIAMFLATLFSARPVVMPSLGMDTLPPPSDDLTGTFIVIELIGLLIVAAIGVVVLVLVWNSEPAAESGSSVATPEPAGS